MPTHFAFDGSNRSARRNPGAGMRSRRRCEQEKRQHGEQAADHTLGCVHVEPRSELVVLHLDTGRNQGATLKRKLRHIVTGMCEAILGGA